MLCVCLSCYHYFGRGARPSSRRDLGIRGLDPSMLLVFEGRSRFGTEGGGPTNFSIRSRIARIPDSSRTWAKPGGLVRERGAARRARKPWRRDGQFRTRGARDEGPRGRGVRGPPLLSGGGDSSSKIAIGSGRTPRFPDPYFVSRASSKSGQMSPDPGSLELSKGISRSTQATTLGCEPLTLKLCASH